MSLSSPVDRPAAAAAAAAAAAVAEGNTEAAPLSDVMSKLAAAGAGFQREIPVECLTCPACNGKNHEFA